MASREHLSCLVFLSGIEWEFLLQSQAPPSVAGFTQRRKLKNRYHDLINMPPGALLQQNNETSRLCHDEVASRDTHSVSIQASVQDRQNASR